MVIPHLMPELAAEQRAALAQNVKTPIVYTNVVVRNWRPWAALKISGIAAPMSFHSTVSLDFPVSLGGYRHPRDPSEPMALHLVHVAGAPNQGLTAREQFHAGQRALLQMTFADFEVRVGDELDRMLGPGGFSSARDIAAITVNRWPHGYAYTYDTLGDPDLPAAERPHVIGRRPFGRIAIANADSGAAAFTNVAIDQAHRAVGECLVSRGLT
jgi:spermidine dehydrogenase